MHLYGHTSCDTDSILYFCVWFICCVAAICVSAEQWNTILSVDLGTEATIVCGFSALYPAWKGPPLNEYNLNLEYNFGGSATFNFYLGWEKLSRMSWATNNRDLRLSPVVLDDIGVYECGNNVQRWSVKVELRGRHW